MRQLHVIEEKISMNKIFDVFKNKKAFIPFITCGDPSLSLTAEAVKVMEKAGADIIELGVPFSDPTAEGPDIQAADERALKAGTTPDKIFDMIENIREEVSVPLILVTYGNVVFSYGIDRFADRAAKTGVAGIVVQDVPCEEKEEFDEVFRKYGIAMIMSVAHTSKERIKMIAENAEGFINCVLTADTKDAFGDIRYMVSEIKKVKDIPCVVAHDFLTVDSVKEIAGLADGVIASADIVKICAGYEEKSIPRIAEYVKMIKEVL